MPGESAWNPVAVGVDEARTYPYRERARIHADLSQYSRETEVWKEARQVGGDQRRGRGFRPLGSGLNPVA